MNEVFTPHNEKMKSLKKSQTISDAMIASDSVSKQPTEGAEGTIDRKNESTVVL
jgi:hypothetical protein